MRRGVRARAAGSLRRVRVFRVSKRAVTQSALHGPQMREACIPPFRHSGPRAGIHPQKGPPTLSRVEGSSGGGGPVVALPSPTQAAKA